MGLLSLLSIKQLCCIALTIYQIKVTYDYEEERRLAYVSLTRGMQRVSISHAAYRAGFARPSPFIDDIMAENQVVGWLHGGREPTAAEIRLERKHRSDREIAALLHR